MQWAISHRADPAAKPLADRHYNRQTPESDQFAPPGSCLVLLTSNRQALWITSNPIAAYVKHAWAGAWVNSLFRNEGAGLSSELIRQAVAATRFHYGDPPPLGMVTFVDPDEVTPKHTPGWCYERAGFIRPTCPYCTPTRISHRRRMGPFCVYCEADCGLARTKGGLIAWLLLAQEMPPPGSSPWRTKEATPMTHPLPSMSALPRVVECPTSEIYPHSDTTSPAAEYGTNVHDFMPRVRDIGFAPALAEIPEDAPHRRLCEAIPPDLVPRGGTVEMALAYNVVTGRARTLGQNLRRQYGKLGATEIPGSIDYSHVRGDEGTLLDWKTGHRWLGPVARYWQIIGLSVAFAARFNLRRVRAGLVYLREDQSPLASVADFDAMQLAAHGEELRRLRLTLVRLRRQHAQGQALPTRQGSWCTYCPAYDACDAKQALLRELRDGALGGVDASTISDEEAGVLWVRLADEFGPLLKRLRARLEERAERKPFPTPRGTMVCLAPGDSREEIDGRKALPVLRERYGAEAAEAACSIATSKKAVADAARSHAKATGAPIGKEITAAMQVLRDAGAVTERPGTVAVREVDHKSA